MKMLVRAITLAVCGAGSPAAKRDTSRQGPEQLSGCPRTPNCVSSEARDTRHAVAPLRLNGDPAAAWESIIDRVSRLPRSEVVQATGHYLHVTIKSRLFGFVDDLEILWENGTDRVAIRSASRTGYTDLGVNRRRIEQLRSNLKQAACIQ